MRKLSCLSSYHHLLVKLFSILPSPVSSRKIGQAAEDESRTKGNSKEIQIVRYHTLQQIKYSWKVRAWSIQHAYAAWRMKRPIVIISHPSWKNWRTQPIKGFTDSAEEHIVSFVCYEISPLGGFRRIVCKIMPWINTFIVFPPNTQISEVSLLWNVFYQLLRSSIKQIQRWSLIREKEFKINRNQTSEDRTAETRVLQFWIDQKELTTSIEKTLSM